MNLTAGPSLFQIVLAMTASLELPLYDSAVDHLPAEIDLSVEHRRYSRYLARGKVILFRQNDRMRFGLTTELWDVSVEGLSFISSTELPVGEMLQMTLRNDLQRFAKDLRGHVRWCEVRPDGRFRVGVELLLRLTGGDISLLKRAVQNPGMSERQEWF